MSKGNDTSGHPGRMVPKERWKPTTAISGPMGAVTAHVNPSGMDRDDGHYMAAWAGPQGHHAEVTRDVSLTGAGPYNGVSHERYVAGPFRTNLRAQVAAESLSSRVGNESGHEKYENDSWTEYRRRG